MNNTGDVATIRAAFGAQNRTRLLEEYFETHEVSAENAWRHVYRLLLWADRSNGLAHCYESDKSQPGKTWYARSLAFHDWLSTQLETSPRRLGEELDWLFRRATVDLIAETLRRASAVRDRAEKQRRPYEDKGLPQPGEDPELAALIRETLGGHFATDPSPEEWALLTEKVRNHFAVENKRKNLVGEGFEDVIAAVIQQSCAPSLPAVYVRQLLHQLPGFNQPRQAQKPNKVDLAVFQGDLRALVTAKWSVRADREKQFHADFSDYVAAESAGKPFQYVLVTNEFDPARLVRACNRLASHTYMFHSVVHISTAALRAAYAGGEGASMREVLDLIQTGRLMSLSDWLGSLNTGSSSTSAPSLG